jgi:uncharacterized surface protein with fasciclin (FAS1) repeats
LENFKVIEKMKNLQKILQRNLVAGLVILTIFSCNKKWDEYYVRPEYLNNGSVFQVLAGNPDYSQFVSLIKKTGYDSLLTSNSTFTVLALRNGSFAGIDTTNIPALKKVIGMHIINSEVFSDGMNNNRILSVSGKLLKFAFSQSGQLVNGIAVKALNNKGTNGVIHEVEKVILPLSNLYESLLANPELSSFKTYIDSSFKLVIDPERNIKVGYDTSFQPIYQQPVIYKQMSDYLATSHIDDESAIRTAFMPTNTAVNKALSNLLTARSGRKDLLIPRIGTKHNDTTIGYVFIPNGVGYQGDSLILLDYLFTHPIIDKDIPAMVNNVETYTNIKGNQFTVSQTQLKTVAATASNGTYYTLNDITLPDVVYRPKFMFLPDPKVPNPANPATTINNPNIIFSGGTNTSPSQTSNSSCYTGKYTRFNFVNVGGNVDFNFPFATKGRYKVNLNCYLDNNGSIVSANYGSQLLRQNLNSSTQYAVAAGMVKIDLGVIDVASDGLVKITFTCTGVSPRTAAKYEFCVDLVELLPVQGP